MNRPIKSEAAFADLIRARLMDTDQVREMVGLESIQGLMHRVDHGHYSGPIVVRERGYALWDRVQVEREEKERLAAVEKDLMANEYQDLATINDDATEAVVTVRRMYQENGGKGIEIVVDHNHGEVVEIFKVEDLVPHR